MISSSACLTVRWRRRTGPAQLDGRSGRDLEIALDRRKPFVEALRRCRDTGNPLTIEFSTSRTVTPQWRLGSINLIRGDGDGQQLLTYVATDITERKQLEEQFLQAQKMEAIGRLAGGIAHDFNNLLTVIGGSAEFLLVGKDESDPDWEEAVEVKRAADRAAVLTRQLLAFSRRQLVRPQDIDLNMVVRDAEKMLRRLIGADVVMKTNLAATAPWIHIDPGQIEQVLVNLVINARDAMPLGGALTIGTSVESVDPSRGSSFRELQPGDYAVLTVTDTGTGMDESTRARIFEPFFTTKDPGKGTGLGLSTVFGIVSQAGGHVLVQSELGRGSTFQVFLRLMDAAEQSERVLQQPVATVGGSETILLVEDEPRVRRFARRALEERGYTVLEAAGGLEALELSDAYSEPIQLVLTDVVLPSLNGRELVETLEQRRPGIRVLFTSGYTSDAPLHHRVAELGAPFLHKPFTIDALLRAVRAAIDGR
jgi:two-component system, cell cycle sensor histidine kinase and response regulator CckA